MTTLASQEARREDGNMRLPAVWISGFGMRIRSSVCQRSVCSSTHQVSRRSHGRHGPLDFTNVAYDKVAAEPVPHDLAP